MAHSAFPFTVEPMAAKEPALDYKKLFQTFLVDKIKEST
jgi:hypothetical protein